MFFSPAFREEIAVQESSSFETVDDVEQSAPDSQASLISAPPASTVVSPKLSEQHMGSRSGSTSQEEPSDVSDDIGMRLSFPPTIAPIKKKFLVNIRM